MTDREKQIQIFDKYGNYDFPTDIKQKEHNTATTQIEEMAKDIVRSAGLGVYEKVEYLYDLGYRKIPEDSVVLTKEEYNSLLKVNSELAVLEKSIPILIAQVRKETAREILIKGKQLVKKWLSRDDEKVGFIFDFEEFIKKHFGVEIKE